MKRMFVTLATTGALAALLPATAAAHVQLNSFSISPSCTTPGGTVQVQTKVTQNHWYHLHTLWSRVQIRQAQTGVVLTQSDEGPRQVPFGVYNDTRTQTLPANTPAGDYNVYLLLGSTAGASDWGSAYAPLKVRALQVLCNVS
jgi:hypothetical protein